MKTLYELVEIHVARYVALGSDRFAVKCRAGRLRRFAKWMECEAGVSMPNQLRPELLSRWLLWLSTRRIEHTGLPLKQASIASEIRYVSVFCGWLGKEGFSVCGLADIFAGRRRARLLPKPTPIHKEIRKALERMPMSKPSEHMTRTIAEILYSSGIRPCELLRMDVGDVNIEEGTFKVLGKGKRERIVFLGEIARRFLETYLAGVRPLLLREPDEKALWLGYTRKRLGYQSLRLLLMQLPTANGKPLTAYVFRRAFSTEMIRAGVSPWMLKEMLGHTDLSQLQHYVQLTILDLKNTHACCHPRDRMD
jgi:integrase/recombinase XerD